jgi:hypothetical protein
MLEIDGQHIHLTRGDAGYIDLLPRVKDPKTGAYVDRTLEEGDTMVFRAQVGNRILEKNCAIDLEHNLAQLTFLPSDTEDLEFKTYFYEIEFVSSHGEPYTCVEWQKFTIGKEVPKHEQQG